MRGSREAWSPLSGPYWTEPLPIKHDELNPSILREIDKRAGTGSFEGYVLQIFDGLEAQTPCGVFKIALDVRAGIACAVYEAKAPPGSEALRSAVLSTEPYWFAASSPQNAADVFYQVLVDHGEDA